MINISYETRSGKSRAWTSRKYKTPQQATTAIRQQLEASGETVIRILAYSGGSN